MMINTYYEKDGENQALKNGGKGLPGFIYIYNFFILLKFQSFILFLVPFSICIFKFQPFSGVYESVILDMLGHGAKHKSKNIPHIWHGFVQNGDESHLAM